MFLRLIHQMCIEDDGVEPYVQGLPYGNGPVIRRVQSATLLVNWRD